MKPRFPLRALTALLLAALVLLAGCGSEPAPAVSDPPAPAPSAAPGYTPEPIAPQAEEERPLFSVEPPAISVPAGAVEVSDVDELLEALAPGAAICLAPGIYDLSAAANYGEARKNGAYFWEEVYDGYGLVLSGLEGLRLLAPEGAEIVTRPRYANVLSAENCPGLTLAGLTLGHTPETGLCTGGVVCLRESDGVTLESCRLYGCGMLGLDAENCAALTLRFTEIYECSLAALRCVQCEELLLSDCAVHDCGRKDDSFYGWPLFETEFCPDAALLNTRVFDNRCTYLLRSWRSPRAAMLGCEVEHNEVTDAVFLLEGQPLVVEGCAFRRPIPLDYPFYLKGSGTLYALDRAGTELLSYDLRRMEYARADAADLEAIRAADEEAVPSSGEMREVRASTVDELLAAIAPNTTVLLEPGEYVLSEASDYGRGGGDYWHWERCFDGAMLMLDGLENFRIVGAGSEATRIVTEPRYASVFYLRCCEEISLEGFTAGHTPKAGFCSGDVLTMLSCSGVRVRSCALFGCGVWGLNLVECEDMEIRDTEIYECSSGAAVIVDCRAVDFSGCSIHDCDEGLNGITVTGGSVRFDGARLSEGWHLFDHGEYLGQP